MADSKPTKKGRPENWSPPKGGARYPQYSLKDALDWSKRLVSKTHLGPQVRDIIFASVVSSKGPTAEIKVSALKQFNLLEGKSTAYNATALAKAIAAAPPEEQQALSAQAALSPSVFKSLFDTFHGDEVTIGKLKQRAADLNVHPEKTEHCVSIYLESMVVAGLVTLESDKASHRSAGDANPTGEGTPSSESAVEDVTVEGVLPEIDTLETEELSLDERSLGRTPRAIFHVTVNLDASLDAEKLEKHLNLLKRYGAI